MINLINDRPQNKIKFNTEKGFSRISEIYFLIRNNKLLLLLFNVESRTNERTACHCFSTLSEQKYNLTSDLIHKGQCQGKFFVIALTFT